LLVVLPPRLPAEKRSRMPHNESRDPCGYTRLFDLLPVVREHCYHPEFHGSFSIKAVLPALVPTANYDDLAISDGASASVAFEEIVNPSVSESHKASVLLDPPAGQRSCTGSQIVPFPHAALSRGLLLSTVCNPASAQDLPCGAPSLSCIPREIRLLKRLPYDNTWEQRQWSKG